MHCGRCLTKPHVSASCVAMETITSVIRSLGVDVDTCRRESHMLSTVFFSSYCGNLSIRCLGFSRFTTRVPSLHLCIKYMSPVHSPCVSYIPPPVFLAGSRRRFVSSCRLSKEVHSFLFYFDILYTFKRGFEPSSGVPRFCYVCIFASSLLLWRLASHDGLPLRRTNSNMCSV